MGFLTHSFASTAGKAGVEIDWKAQCSLRSGWDSEVSSSCGQTAPWSIQRRSSSTCSPVSGGPSGGMTTSGSRPET